MKPTTKIRFTEPQIALVMRAHPNCNLDHLIELSFEFDQAGKIIDCIFHFETSSHHSITSSARARKDSGIVRPIAFAALTLTTSSNLVA
jgi:hypothetical protein